MLQSIPIATINVGDRFREDYGNLDDLAESIREKGLIQPITVDQNMNLLAGGRRLAACKLAGMESVPCVVRNTEGELDAREVELVENVMRKDMDWAERARLVDRIASLYRERYGTDYGTNTRLAKAIDHTNGWVTRQRELARALEVMPELAEEKTENDAFKRLKNMAAEVEVQEARAAHREALAGIDLDGITPEDVEQALESASPDKGVNWLAVAEANYNVCDVFEGLASMPDGMADMLEIDPPYGIDLSTVRQERDEHLLASYGEIPAEEYPAFLERLCREAFRVAAPDSWTIFWFGPTWHCQVRAALIEAGFRVDDIPALWIKPAGQTNQPDLYLARAYEPFFIARKGKPVVRAKGRLNWFQHPAPAGDARYHSTQRPLALMEEILETFTIPGQRVLIPFLGSGVTLRACYRLDRMGFGFDLSQEHKDRFMLRVEQDIKENIYPLPHNPEAF